jgi:CrcB protein
MSLLAVILVAVGGAVGAVARALAGRFIRSDFPLATLLVNIGGSFLLALAYAGPVGDNELLRALIGAGFCGAFTTFSTFILEVVLLLRAGSRRRALLYLGLTLGLCCLASWGGFSLMT